MAVLHKVWDTIETPAELKGIQIWANYVGDYDTYINTPYKIEDFKTIISNEDAYRLAKYYYEHPESDIGTFGCIATAYSGHTFEFRGAMNQESSMTFYGCDPVKSPHKPINSKGDLFDVPTPYYQLSSFYVNFGRTWFDAIFRYNTGNPLAIYWDNGVCVTTDERRRRINVVNGYIDISDYGVEKYTENNITSYLVAYTDEVNPDPWDGHTSFTVQILDYPYNQSDRICADSAFDDSYVNYNYYSLYSELPGGVAQHPFYNQAIIRTYNMANTEFKMIDGDWLDPTVDRKNYTNINLYTQEMGINTNSVAHECFTVAYDVWPANPDTPTPEQVTLTTEPNNTLFGTASGGGTYDKGATVNISATANEGYVFTKWTQNGTDFSTSAKSQITLTENTDLIAVFEEKPPKPPIFCDPLFPEQNPAPKSIPITPPTVKDPWYQKGGNEVAVKAQSLDFTPVPNVSASDSGFSGLYKVNIATVKELADYMWTENIIAELKKFITDPYDLLQSLVITYESPDAYGGLTPIFVGLLSNDKIKGVPVRQYKEDYVGYVAIPKKYDSFLDYNPYTKVKLHLPYVGDVPLNADLVIGNSLSITKKIDFMTGNVCYTVNTQAVNENGEEFLFFREEFHGNCFSSIPISKQEGGLATGLATLGLTAAAVGAIIVTGGAAEVAAGAASVGVSSSVSGVKERYQSRSTPSSASLLTDIDNVYLTITRPIVDIPSNYGSQVGFPCNAGGRIGDFKGYLEVESVILDGINAPLEELNEIESLLRGGIIV